MHGKTAGKRRANVPTIDWTAARRLWEAGVCGTTELARRMGVTPQAVKWHRKREGWQHAALPAAVADAGKLLDARSAEIRGLRRQHQLQQGGLRLLLSVLLHDMQRGGDPAQLHARALALRAAIQSAQMLATWEMALSGVSYENCIEAELPNEALDAYESEMRRAVKAELQAEIHAALQKPDNAKGCEDGSSDADVEAAIAETTEE